MVGGIEGWVPRGVVLRTPPGPEGSNGKRDTAGAVGVPDPSRLPQYADLVCVDGRARSLVFFICMQ